MYDICHTLVFCDIYEFKYIQIASVELVSQFDLRMRFLRITYSMIFNESGHF